MKRFFICLIVLFLTFQSAHTWAQKNTTKTIKYINTSPESAEDYFNLLISAKINRQSNLSEKNREQLITKYEKSQNESAEKLAIMGKAMEDLSIKDNLILMRCEGDDTMRGFAYVLFVVRAISSKDLTDMKRLSDYVRLYEECIKKSKNKHLLFWKPFMKQAQIWLKNDGQGGKGYVPMIIAASTFQNLSDIAREDFIAYHKTILNRPDISGLKFNKQEIGEYIKSIKDPLLSQAEHRRYSTLFNRVPREHLCGLFARNTYAGKIYYKKNSSASNGVIARVNEREIITKASTSASSPPRKCVWEDFKLTQFASLLIYFADRRLNTKSREGEAKHKLDAGDEYLMASLIYLFDSEPGKAYDAAIRAESLSPTLRKKIKYNFCDSLPSEEEHKPTTQTEALPESTTPAQDASSRALNSFRGLE